MASESITIRFPSGAWEFSLTSKPPQVGDTLVRQGVTWVVAQVTESSGQQVVTMARAPEVADS